MRNRLKQVFVFTLLALVSLALVACNKKTKKPTDDFDTYGWRTPGYVQGDFGNVPRLGADGVAVMDNSIPDSRIFTSTINGKAKPLRTTMYYEVNDTNILNASTLTIGDTGVPFVDIVIIFAANINWDSAKQQPYLHLNYQVNATLEGYQKYIKPLQDMGIKVVLDIMPNHGGVGFLNLTPEWIEIFTDQLVEAVDKYGLDGLDFDEEYAGYGNNGIPSRQPNSMTNMLIRLREKMPNKIISVFNYALPTDMSTRGPELVEKGVVDYAYANYGSGGGNPAYVSGREKYTYSSYELSRGGLPSYTRQFNDATNAMRNRNGFLMYFNIHNYITNPNSHLNYPGAFSGMTQAVYGMDVVWNGKYYMKDYA